MTESYDSMADTRAHIDLVASFIENFLNRAVVHDASKLEAPEKPVFDRVTPTLRALTYGSDEYKASLAEMGEALAHHYQANTHHPEHYPNGINGMSLFDIVEMAIADWPAAVSRHADGDLVTSLAINRKRFKMTAQLARIIRNTWVEMGLVPARSSKRTTPTRHPGDSDEGTDQCVQPIRPNNQGGE